MHALKLFGLLSAGVVVLVACWLAAFATLAAWMLLTPGGGLPALLGIPVVVVLLVVGFGLALAVADELEPDAESGGPTGRALVAFFLAACGALVVAGSVIHFSGAQIYHVRHGERTEAVVSFITEFTNDSGGVVNRWFHVEDSATGEDLGPLATYPLDEAREGDRITVFADPDGWVRPVPVDRTGWTAVPTAILLGAAGVVALGAVGVLATGLVVLITRRPR